MARMHFDDETRLVAVVAGGRVLVLDITDVDRAGTMALACAAWYLPTPPDAVWAVTGRTSIHDDDELTARCGLCLEPKQ